jgi:threonine dehydrogenase-like Zn-dependent dehydrogenase
MSGCWIGIWCFSATHYVCYVFEIRGAKCDKCKYSSYPIDRNKIAGGGGWGGQGVGGTHTEYCEWPQLCDTIDVSRVAYSISQPLARVPSVR